MVESSKQSRTSGSCATHYCNAIQSNVGRKRCIYKSCVRQRLRQKIGFTVAQLLDASKFQSVSISPYDIYKILTVYGRSLVFFFTTIYVYLTLKRAGLMQVH